MRIRLFTIAVAALLLALAVAPNSMAQGNKHVNNAKVTFSKLIALGSASLTPSTSPSTPSGPQGPLEMDPWAAGKHTLKGSSPQPGTPAPAGPTPLTIFPIAPGIGALNVDWNALNNGDNRNVNAGNIGEDLEPPDQGLCVGNGSVIEAINNVMVFYDTSGTGTPLTTPMSLYDFYLRPHADLLSDPRCYYDTNDGRFFITELDFQNFFSNTGGPFRSYLLIAVSNDNNPLHGFGLFAIDTTDDGSDGTPLHSGCPCLPDQPIIGADAFGFYISTNEFQLFGPDYNDVQIYAVSKSLLEGFVVGTVVHFNNVKDSNTIHYTYSIHPSIAPDVGGGEPAGGTEFLLSARDFAAFVTTSRPTAAVTSVAAWAITGTSTLVNNFPSLTLSEALAVTEAYNASPNAKQKGSSNLLRTNDDRMNQVMFEGGFLQAALMTGNPPVGGGSTYPAAAWFVIKPTLTGSVITGATKIKNNYVVGPTVGGNNTSLLFPALAVNAGNTGIISFSLTRPGTGSAGFFPSTAYIHYSESSGAYGSIQVVGKGVTFENGFTCSPCRWGDYSWAILDDLDPTQMWLATENIDGVASDSNVNWSTHIAGVPVP
jgi:hypothetical protein